MSEQTIRRKLSAEGVNYQQLKDNLRSDLAMRLLNKSSVPIQEIARLLNFSEPRAFTRAFKQWTGHSPRHFRNQGLTRAL